MPTWKIKVNNRQRKSGKKYERRLPKNSKREADSKHEVSLKREGPHDNWSAISADP
jgi:hypothetical protein